MTLTIPACLEALGGMQEGDPALTPESRIAISWWQLRRYPPCPSPRLLVEQSEPTLLRVLCRHLGWEGNHQVVLRIERRGVSNNAPVWVLRNLTKWNDAPVLDEDGPNFYVKLPAHISTDFDYLEALAESVVWHARIGRLKCGFAGSPEALTLAEQRCGAPMPTWAVQR